VGVVWSYTGLPPKDMSDRVVGFYERALSTTVNDIEHIESSSLNGVGVVKIYFQPSANIDRATAQVTAVSQTLLKQMPPGTTPPLILQYDASSVPILQLALSSPRLLESQLFDAGNNFIRSQLSTVQGAAIPYPYGGRQRQVQVDVDPQALRRNGLSAQDVANVINEQNLIVPAGTQKIGELEVNVNLNSAPDRVEELNDAPIRLADGKVIHVRDVANVRDGFPPQTNVVRVEGRRSVLMTIVKTGNASTLDIIERVKAALPFIQAGLPKDLEIHPLGDQSLFVRAAVSGVVREAIIAGALTATMILLFLGSLRSTFIIVISIPLAILSAIAALSALGETINIMTLGGLALAVGILVDDATVTIENINYQLEQGKDVETAILDGAHQIATPALVSTLAICIVFVPMFYLTGVSKYLFVPLAEGVVFAMLASYVLSRTLVPTLAKYWLKAHSTSAAAHGSGNVFSRFQRGFERRFEAVRAGYRRVLESTVANRGLVAVSFIGAAIVSMVVLSPWLGRDFFPSVDAGQIKLHVRAPSGLRLEESAALADRIENRIRKVIPASELESVVDNIGLPYSGINLIYNNAGTIGPNDADILITLKPGHEPTADYIRKLRRLLPGEFPATNFSFLPADIVTQILNFGLPAPIDVQVIGRDREGNRSYANLLLERIKRIPGAADVRLQQVFNSPELEVQIDRTKAAELGLSQKDVANDLLTALSGSFQTSPTFWADRKSGVQYPIATQVPQYALTGLQELQNLPVTSGPTKPYSLLSNVSTFAPGVTPAVVTHYNALPSLDIYGSVQDADLGTVAARIQAAVDETAAQLPKGSKVVVRGQIQTMHTAYTELLGGLVVAILLVYLLIVVNFQSWLDAFIIVAALPVALAGIVWMLFFTYTHVSVPALTGAIMSMGVATANSILVISFARERLAEGVEASRAAIEAGFIRFRPVLMTAGAMIIGMIPMALGLGDGGEQNAPLGRAVIGGLLAATTATLFFVPSLFALMHRQRKPVAASTGLPLSGFGAASVLHQE
jgi:multidrug efflux pump subunit AcrB